jgi:hypothetical protein
MNFIICFLFSTALLQIEAVRIAILNDVHLNLTYDYGCSFPFCYDNGMYGLDPPSQLVDTLLDDMQKQHPTLDAILI